VSEKLNLLNKFLTYAFYAIFAITPLVMFPSTYEIFEFNKMWFVFGITIFIAFIWGSKIILTKTIAIKRSPLDIPILLFLASQILATIFSIDPYVSWWGYYSRFNGGLLSTITYVFLYFALTTHLTEDKTLSVKILVTALLGGVAVSLWGLPSHFGLDPTCFVFGRGLSTECWTDAFKPTIRIFSTLGQPNWLAAYLAALIPSSIAFAALSSKKDHPHIPFMEKLKLVKREHIQLFFTLTTILFFIDLLYTRSKSGYVGFWIGLVVTLALYLIPIFYHKKLDIKKITSYFTLSSPNGPTRQTVLVLTLVLLALTFIIGVPLEGIEKYTLQGIIEKAKATQESPTPSVQNPVTGDALGGTDSGQIRLIVWEGAINVVSNYPLFGSGPETFGYIYYKYRPPEHNLTSEWDYLYNKAHNEYLNYAATSGVIGLLSYLSLITVFLITSLIALKRRNEYKLLALALIGGYVSILVSNFFGFSVVNINLLFFLTPALFYSILQPQDKYNLWTIYKGKAETKASTFTIILILILGAGALFYELKLFNIWRADQQFALGSNLNKIGEVVQANEYLEKAVNIRPQEPLYKNELSLNLATIAYASHLEGQSTQAAQLAQRAEELSNEVTTNHPHNVVFYKTRTRTMYALAQMDSKYIEKAIASIEHAKKLAPTDAKVSYNVGIIYTQSGMTDAAIEEFKEATDLKPDYRDPYYGTALVALQEAERSPEKSEKYNQIARVALEKILEMNPEDREARDLLDTIN